ncbi:MAG: fibronectin type III domain-containing protein [Rhizobacter sp.]|nr:fibronectin type III domain-containing protein [Rhizobacter sp.]
MTFTRLGLALAMALTLALSACGGGGSDSGPSTPTTPASGQQLTAVGTSAHTVSLAWTPPATATTYAVERRTGTTGPYTRIATVDAASGAYVDDGLTQGTTYSYRLVSTDAAASPLAAGSATTGDDAALITAPGTALGASTQATLGSAAASIASPDGRITLELPAGSVSTGTTVETQAVSNTAPDGRGDALRVRLSAVPTQNATLRVRYDEADAPLADGLRIAVQRTDGSWLSLPLTQIDKTTRTLVAPLPIAMLAPSSAQAQATRARPHGPGDVSVEFTVVRYLAFHLAPRQASVAVGGTLQFVPYARVRGYEVEIGICEPINDEQRACIYQPVLETRQLPFLNTKPGYTRGWYVFLQQGGSATDGTIVPSGEVGATYTAPQEVPDPETVVVSFQSTHQRTGRTVVLASPVTITDDRWVGTISATDGPSIAGTTAINIAHITWRRDLTAGNATTQVYRAEGTVGVTVTDDDCTVTITPSVHEVSTDRNFVSLEIDRGVTPARYRLRLITFWNGNTFAVCPRASSSVDGLLGYGWDVQGVLGESSFSGHTTQETARIEWSFQR